MLNGGSQGLFFSLIQYFSIYFFKYETIETYIRAFFMVMIFSIGSVSKLTLMFMFFSILGSVNHLLLVTNSSLNFLIYCCMASRFRIALYDLFLNINYALCKRDKQDQSIYSQVDVINRPESNRYD